MLPVVWSSEQINAAPREARVAEFWEEARAHQVRHGWIFSGRGIAGQIGLLSLSRSAGVLSSRELADAEPKMMWLAQTASSVVSSIVSDGLRCMDSGELLATAGQFAGETHDSAC
jgi:LuxR family transcriptional regulator